ncbi:solute carrier family 25 member 36-like [Dysidea avara]|uniref:solute carrier family 25 member 36-like n=1 Tax=Dysidea avara TaxID=196820 RepID=UPI00331D9E6F
MNDNIRVNPAIQLAAGGLAGATGAIATSPLEFLKTRLQSTTGQQFLTGKHAPSVVPYYTGTKLWLGLQTARHFSSSVTVGASSVVKYFEHIYTAEGGLKAFYKGLRPALIGIIPGKAIYFLSYSKYKELFNRICCTPNSDQVHLLSAVSAGATMSTITSPIWVIKTRVQLDTGHNRIGSIAYHIQRIWHRDGFKGFYRGLSASYAGAAETGVYFVFYERLKIYFASRRDSYSPMYMDYLLSASAAKLLAVSLCYPHEVVRTRLRQDSTGPRKYRSFVQTLLKVWSEERLVGLYGGMSLHLLRAVPNTAITFLTYEAVMTIINSYNFI